MGFPLPQMLRIPISIFLFLVGHLPPPPSLGFPYDFTMTLHPPRWNFQKSSFFLFCIDFPGIPTSVTLSRPLVIFDWYLTWRLQILSSRKAYSSNIVNVSLSHISLDTSNLKLSELWIFMQPIFDFKWWGSKNSPLHLSPLQTQVHFSIILRFRLHNSRRRSSCWIATWHFRRYSFIYIYNPKNAH